jgi:hypothetical protein
LLLLPIFPPGDSSDLLLLTLPYLNRAHILPQLGESLTSREDPRHAQYPR